MKNEKRIGRLISILYRQSQVYMNYALKELNMSSSEYPFMITLYNNEGINQEELSSRLLIDKAATARAIKSLEEKGYVRREKNEKDKRSNKIYVTDKGKSCQDKIQTALNGWTQLLTEGINDEVNTLVFNTLKTMTEKIGNVNCKEFFNDRGVGHEENR
jgi:DNA-binding MarR family transcriptional regulator